MSIQAPSQQVLSGNRGSNCSYYLHPDHLYLEKIVGSGSGSGTELVGRVMEIALSNGRDGAMKLSASWASHVFWLLMGMEPEQDECYDKSYLGYAYGTYTLGVVAELLEGGMWDNEDRGDLVRCYARETGVKASDVTDEMLLAYRDQFEALSKKTVAYAHCFFNDLFSVMERKKTTKRFDTNGLGMIEMKMSAEGIARWKEALETGKPFVPFRDFSHVRKHLDERLSGKLDAILESWKVA